ncbi:hypothetical protein [Streptomyces antibioticus]|uniref:hypothetical protein n=1 Tax=Streptomyces antibioticus TaxID=1890 RepID=UPI0022535188|nr:hypothetical protein [Streptomyces antibioticus]MCX4742467.1 hypothetical protein [Streptomyces antibioticus]
MPARTLTRRSAGLVFLLLALVACTADSEPEKGKSTYEPKNDVTITQYGTEATKAGLEARAEYRIRNNGTDPLTYTIVFVFLDGDGYGVAQNTVHQRVNDHATYTGTVSTPWDSRSGSSGARVTDVTVS